MLTSCHTHTPIHCTCSHPHPTSFYCSYVNASVYMAHITESTPLNRRLCSGVYNVADAVVSAESYHMEARLPIGRKLRAHRGCVRMAHLVTGAGKQNGVGCGYCHGAAAAVRGIDGGFGWASRYLGQTAANERSRGLVVGVQTSLRVSTVERKVFGYIVQSVVLGGNCVKNSDGFSKKNKTYFDVRINL